MSSRARILIMVLILTPLLASLACSLFQDEGSPLPNRPPEVHLASGPPPDDLDSGYRVTFHWTGYDPDGPIDRFQYLITDDEVTGTLLIDADIYARLDALGYEWTDTEVNSGEFLVTADSLPDAESVPGDSIYYYGERFLFHAAHSFFIRAVDGDGAVSLMPDYRSFTSVNVAPEVFIEHPYDMAGPGGYDNMSLDVYFRWAGADTLPDGTVADPDSTRFALLDRGELGMDSQDFGLMITLPDSIWSPWRHWGGEGAEDSGGRYTWVNDLENLAEYLFLVQARDEAGAITSHYEDGKNLRKIRAIDSMQPLLVVREPTLGTRVTDHDVTWHFTVAADRLLSLGWSGQADQYGNELVGYRYAWDLIDTGDDELWSDWSLDHTSAQASFPSGDHEFYLECMDLSGNVTQVILIFHVVPFTMEYDLLFVDDYDNDNTHLGWPLSPEYSWSNFSHDDASMKAWWEVILGEYSGHVPGRDFFRVTITEPVLPLEILASYRRVIWEVKEETDGESGIARSERFVDPYVAGSIPNRALSEWLDHGGQLLLCGVNPVHAMLPMSFEMGIYDYVRKQPLVFLNHLGYSQGSPGDSEAAVQSFLPWRHFGIDATVKAVDQNPRNLGDATGLDFVTRRSCWGMVGATPHAESRELFGNSAGWMPGDTLRFQPDVYRWFADAAEVFGGGGCCEELFGLSRVEIYNWDWLAGVVDPPLAYRTDQYLPLVSYLPADSTTRWGSAPAAEHTCETDQGQPYCELCYATGEGAGHMLGVVGLRDPERPSVLLGMTPFYLEQETAHGLLDHVLMDIFDLEK